MSFLKALGKWFWRFMVIFSFIVNLVLLIVVLALVLLIFDIKENIAQPLVGGLHSSFVGLDQATIDWTIPVREEVPVNLDIALEQNTEVILTAPVPLNVTANIVAPSLSVSNAQVTLSLPAGLRLPVSLDLDVPVRDTLPVSLDVRAVIPLEETQLHDVAENLRLLFEPLAVGLYNLPGDFTEAGAMVGDVLRGEPPNLLAPNAYSVQPWPGFSRTAGLNYRQDLLTAAFPPNNVPEETGIVPVGGIPAIDEQIRPEIYADGLTPAEINAQAIQNMEAQGVQGSYFDGGFNTFRLQTIVNPGAGTDDSSGPPDAQSTGENGATGQPSDPVQDMGIIPTPTPTQ